MRKNIFSWKSLAGLALLIGLTMGVSSCAEVELPDDSSNPGATNPTEPNQKGGTDTKIVMNNMTKPSDFKTLYDAWLAERQAAIASAKKPADAQKAFDEAATLTIELHTSGLNVTKDDFTIDMDWIHDAGLGRKVIELVFTNEFKKADVALLLTDENGKYPVYDITLPANEKDFDLDVNLPNSAAIMHAAEGEVTKLGILTTSVSSFETVGDDWWYNGDYHTMDVKGLTLGEGLAIDAFAPQAGDVVVDGAEINAYGILPDKYYKSVFSDTKGFNLCYGSFSTYSAAGKKDVYVKTVKVFPSVADPANVPYLDFNDAKETVMDNLFITSGAKVTVGWANLTNIEGENKEKSEVYFQRGTENATSNNKGYWTWNVQSVKTVTITNSYLNLNATGVPAEVLDDCIIQATNVLVYPEAGLTNNTFKPASKTATQWIQVVPPVQSKDTPDYTYTFTDVNFNANKTHLYVSDNFGHFVGGTPIIDDETGEWAYRIKYHYAYYDSVNGWQWTYSYNKSDIPAEALAMDYWYEVPEYYYSADDVVSHKKIDDYTVTIALNNCKVNGKDADKKSGIYEIYEENSNDPYDINDKFSLNGVLYTPERVYYTESENGNNKQKSEVWLTKD